MNQTEHVGLNQWDPEDRILREDFNADNAKIDAALAGKLGHASLYWSSPATPGSQPSGPATINPTGLVKDWNRYEYVLMLVDIPEDGQRTGSPLEIRIGDNPPEVIATIPEDSFIVIFRSLRNASNKIQGTILSAGGVKLFTCQRAFSQFSYMVVSPTEGHMASSGLTFVGFQ